MKTYAQRVADYESQGMTTSDAQGVCDAEDLKVQRQRTYLQAPWYPKNLGGIHNQALVIDEETGASIAVVYDAKHADLIAASPELLMMVRNLVDLASVRGRLDDYKALLNDARAIIAKAEGRA